MQAACWSVNIPFGIPVIDLGVRGGEDRAVTAARAVRAVQAVRHQTVGGLVHEGARGVPDRLAVRYRGRSWTYADLDAPVTTGPAVLRQR